jgi:hypothetical protein
MTKYCQCVQIYRHDMVCAVVRQTHAITNLRGTSDHVLDKVAVSRCIDDSEVVPWGFEAAPEGDVATSVSLLLELVHDPSEPEGPFAHSRVRFEFGLK